MKKIIITVCIAVITCVILAQQTQSPFITKKKMRGLSKSKLKEENAQELGALLQTLPSLIKVIAETQEQSMQKLTEYLESEKNCFWASASCEQLLHSQTKIKTCHAQVVAMHDQMRNFVNFLLTLTKEKQEKAVNLTELNKS